MKPSVSTALSVHWTHQMEASSVKTDSAPFQLTCRSEDGYTGADICIYTGDQPLTDRLVEAFNSIVRARREEMKMADVHSG